MRWLTATLCLLILAIAVAAQQYICGPSGCRIVYTPAVYQVPAVKPAPVASEPVKPVDKSVYTGPLPTGVVPLAPTLGGDKYTYRGVEVDRKRIEAILGGAGDQLADDSKKVTITVAGPDKDRKEILAGLKAKLGAEFKYWDGPSTDWSFESGFSLKGNPVTIYAQLPDGKVIHRQDDLAGGVEAAVEAIRKANPAYDPAKDADKRKADVPAVPSGNTLFLIAAAVAAVLVLSNKKG